MEKNVLAMVNLVCRRLLMSPRQQQRGKCETFQISGGISGDELRFEGKELIIASTESSPKIFVFMRVSPPIFLSVIFTDVFSEHLFMSLDGVAVFLPEWCPEMQYSPFPILELKKQPSKCNFKMSF